VESSTSAEATQFPSSGGVAESRGGLIGYLLPPIVRKDIGASNITATRSTIRCPADDRMWIYSARVESSTSAEATLFHASGGVAARRGGLIGYLLPPIVGKDIGASNLTATRSTIRCPADDRMWIYSARGEFGTTQRFYTKKQKPGEFAFHRAG